MTAPLDEKGLEAAIRAIKSQRCTCAYEDLASTAIRAYLSATPAPDGMDCDPDGCRAHIDAFMQRAEAAEAQVSALRAALEPFSGLGEVVLAEAPPDALAAWSFQSSDGPHMISLDTFRAAIAAINPAKGETE